MTAGVAINAQLTRWSTVRGSAAAATIPPPSADHLPCLVIGAGGVGLGRATFLPSLPTLQGPRVTGSSHAIAVTCGSAACVYLVQARAPSQRSHVRLLTAKLLAPCAMAQLGVGLASLAGIVGDLAASHAKRLAQLKDYSDALGAHGGFMDRFDGSLFALTAYLVVSWWQ